jgi:hypothetical protein
LTTIVLECVCHRLFKHDCIKTDEIDKRSFLRPLFVNHDIDTINLGNILHHKSVKSTLSYQYCNSTKRSLIPISSKCSGFWLITYLLCLAGRVKQQRVYIPMHTNCVPLLADLCLCSHQADLIQGLLKKKNSLTI